MTSHHFENLNLVKCLSVSCQEVSGLLSEGHPRRTDGLCVHGGLRKWLPVLLSVRSVGVQKDRSCDHGVLWWDTVVQVWLVELSLQVGRGCKVLGLLQTQRRVHISHGWVCVHGAIGT